MKDDYNKLYKLVAINDDIDFCIACGKEELKRVMWLENLETGIIEHYGTTCGARMLGWTKKETSRKINTKIQEMKKMWKDCYNSHPSIKARVNADNEYFEFFRKNNIDRISYCKERNTTPMIHHYQEVNEKYPINRDEVIEWTNNKMGFKIIKDKIIMIKNNS